MSHNQAKYYHKAMIKAAGARAKKLDIDTTYELYFLFTAMSFVRMYRDGTKGDNSKVEKLWQDLDKKSSMFSKNFVKIMDVCTTLFEDVENIEKKKQNKGLKFGYEKRLSFNENGELVVHGLLFALTIILQHRRIPNKKLFLPYALATELYQEFADKKDNIFKNSRILPIKFKKYITEETYGCTTRK